MLHYFDQSLCVWFGEGGGGGEGEGGGWGGVKDSHALCAFVMAGAK